jgi:hypothetical protein
VGAGDTSEADRLNKVKHLTLESKDKITDEGQDLR